MDRRLYLSKSHSLAVLFPHKNSDNAGSPNDTAHPRKYSFQHYQKPKYHTIDRQDLTDEESKLIFKILDSNKAGYLTPEDLLSTLEKSGEFVTNDDVNQFFEIVDEDLDSVITYDDFYSLMNS
ncbi:unnamed protein product [Blepharisma stoltei]|uniref:EF-hand domain-containing protein n=1 Tax=Blepharisma stoltei TaxID=1481888 RepID=A0AAU9IQV9_9CILI|nr:unnamed protein product [Blepharisma stoltei]